MTRFDRAFIKVYSPQGGMPASVGTAGPEPLPEAPGGPPSQQAPDAPTDAPPDAVFNELGDTPGGTGELPASGGRGRIGPEAQQADQHAGQDAGQHAGEQADQRRSGAAEAPCALETALTGEPPPAFAPGGCPAVGGEKARPAATAQPPGVAHRLDPRLPDQPGGSPPGPAAVPPPHIRVPASDVPQRVDTPAEAEIATETADSAEGESNADANIGPPGADRPERGLAAADLAGQPFRPMLQVDRFSWPSVCRRLGEAARAELDRLAGGLVDALARGQRVVAIAGCRRGEGTTTMLLCAAQRLAQRGLKVVIADADLADPQVAWRLEVLPQFGWEHVVSGRLPLEEVLIESAEDRLAVLPVCEAFGGTGEPTKDETRLADSIDTLVNHYDLVLLDLGPLEDPAVVSGWLARGIGSRLDAILLVHNVRRTPREDVAEIRRALATTEIAPAGVIENFVCP